MNEKAIKPFSLSKSLNLYLLLEWWSRVIRLY